VTASEALRAATLQLRDAGLEGAARDARILLAHALGLPAARLTLHLQDDMTPAAQARFDRAIAARLQRQPVSQIVGYREFWGRHFNVTRDVLDPRPETETLIAAALKEPFDTVLDLGTGSGAILLTLLAERPGARGLGVDMSEAALDVARTNAGALGLSNCRFLRSDWFSQVEGQFDLVVANPPYITAAEMQDLAPEVRVWEPPMALSPGGDGLGAYRAIAAGIGDHLMPQGRLIVEIGLAQAADVTAILRQAGLARIEVRQDMDGRDRIVIARRV
jgi:release factor glutamine methyltransferase